MTELTKATLQVLLKTGGAKGKAKATVRRGEKFEVQLNPTSMRIERRNNTDRGAVTAGGQRRQHTTTEGATLTFDLEFDTADEVDVDVRDKTKDVFQFTLPGEKGAAPPRLEFQWGTFAFRGIMTQVVEELDYFSIEGRPLHAKLSVTIAEQNLAFEKSEDGPGQRDASGATRPNAPSRTGAGAAGTRQPETRVKANDGESAQQLAARLGGDPTAWRSLMNGLESPLAIAPGTTIEVGPELAGTEALAGTGGVGEGLPPTDPVSLSRALSPTARAEAGFVLAEVGGIATAASSVQADGVRRSLAEARAAFDVPVARPSPGGRTTASDPRATTYGASIPLTLRIVDSTRHDVETAGGASVSARARDKEISISPTFSSLPWLTLPLDVVGERRRADFEQRRRDALNLIIRGLFER